MVVYIETISDKGWQRASLPENKQEKVDMKIYTYYRGKVHSLEVKETEKLFIANKGAAAFSFIRRFRKDGCCLTPVAAVNKEIGFLKARISVKRRHLIDDEKRLDKLLHLLVETYS